MRSEHVSNLKVRTTLEEGTVRVLFSFNGQKRASQKLRQRWNYLQQISAKYEDDSEANVETDAPKRVAMNSQG